MTLREILSIDPRIEEGLEVASVKVVEDPALPDSYPWRVVRQASGDALGDGVRPEMEAEVRLSPQLPNRSVVNDHDIQTHLRQMMVVFSHVVHEVGSRTVEFSLDRSLPYSNPYRCLNRQEPISDGRAGYITEVAISSNFATRIEQSPRHRIRVATRYFELDVRTAASYGFDLRPSGIAGKIEVVSNDPASSPYLIAEPLKRVVDLFMVSLKLFHRAANRYESAPWGLLDPIRYNSSELDRLRHAAESEEYELNEYQRYECTQERQQWEQSHLESLSQAIDQTRTSYGDAVTDALLDSIKLCEGDVATALRYIRDFWNIHGYRFGQQQERLENVFEARPLLQITQPTTRRAAREANDVRAVAATFLNQRPYSSLNFV